MCRTAAKTERGPVAIQEMVVDERLSSLLKVRKATRRMTMEREVATVAVGVVVVAASVGVVGAVAAAMAAVMYTESDQLLRLQPILGSQNPSQWLGHRLRSYWRRRAWVEARTCLVGRSKTMRDGRGDGEEEERKEDGGDCRSSANRRAPQVRYGECQREKVQYKPGIPRSNTTHDSHK